MIADVKDPRYERCRIWLNGEEVTRWCCYADDGIGLVKIYKHDDQKRILQPMTLEEKHGTVRIECPTSTDTAP